MNNSPLRKYFGQNYGRKEDSLEARANAAKPMVEYKGQPIFKDQYEALTVVAGQYAKKPEELNVVFIESGLVRKLDLGNIPIKTKDSKLTIPKEFASLQILDCHNNQLDALMLPAELTSLEKLSCGDNQLYSLVLPKELTALQVVDCRKNQLHFLDLPKELISLQQLDCGRNYLQSLVLPKELTSLRHLVCSNNILGSLVLPKELNALQAVSCSGNSLPRELISEFRSRGVTVYE